MNFAKLPIVSPTDTNYQILRGMAYGCSDNPPDGGFSFIVNVSYLQGFLEDCKSDPAFKEIKRIYNSVKGYKFFW